MDYTIQSYDFSKVDDYESDETTVTLIDVSGVAVAEFNYPKFTREDFDLFKSKMTI